jgi:hypothetical protein
MSDKPVVRKFKHKLRVSGLKASNIWAIWKDVANWPQWNKGLAECSIEGPFEQGQTFSLLPKGEVSADAPFTATLTRVEENVAFEDTTPVPWGVVNGSHRISKVGDDFEIYHEINAEVNSNKIEFFDAVVAEKWKAGLPAALETVVAVARERATSI